MTWYEGPFGSISAWAYCEKSRTFHPYNQTVKRLNDKQQVEEIHLDVNTVEFHIDNGATWMNAYAYVDATPRLANRSNDMDSIKHLARLCVIAPKMNDLIVDLANCESDSKELAGFIQEARVICSERMRMEKAMGGE